MVTAVVSLLDSGASGLGSSPTIVFLVILSCHSVSFHPRELREGGTVGCDGPASRQVGKAILLAFSC